MAEGRLTAKCARGYSLECGQMSTALEKAQHLEEPRREGLEMLGTKRK